jgi:hypothetical protein
MPETIEERLAKLECRDKEMTTKFKQLFDDNKDMFASDFVLIGALKRTLSLSDGFRKHIRDHNFICAGTLLRSHLDTALRVNALSLVKKPEQFAQDIMKGDRVDKMKDRDGQRLTDAHLAKKLGETVPWVPAVYDELCSFGHFSNRHIFTPMAETNDDERTVYFQISAEDPKRPEDDYFEIVECFYETERITGNLMGAWHKAGRMRASGQKAPPTPPVA